MTYLRKQGAAADMERLKALWLDGFEADDIVRATGANIHTVRVLIRQLRRGGEAAQASAGES